eukprot:1882713-Pyramimonas_sp.AAC.1
MCKNFTESHDQRTVNGVLKGLKTMRVQQLRGLAVLKSQELRSVTIQDRQDASVRFWNPGNDVLACVGVFKLLLSNEAVPQAEMNAGRGR